MDTISETIISQTQAFQFKGSLFTLTAIQLHTTQLDLIRTQLSEQAQRSPEFFKNTPVIIELQKINATDINLNFDELKLLFGEFGLIPVGVRGGSASQIEAAMQSGLAILSNSNHQNQELYSKKYQTKTKLVTYPVRSGQQIYAKHADLIVMAPVSAGAELLADGHIHVYGILRGRALAGVSGDKSARIFCRSLSAELVSIAGYYWVNEDLKVPFDREGVQIYLKEDRLQLGAL